MKTILLIAGVVAALGTSAFAQDASPPEPGVRTGNEVAPTSSHNPDMREKRRHFHRHAGKSFRLNYGMGVGLHVQCGDEALRECIEASKILLDKLPAYDPSAMGPRRHRDRDRD